MPRLSSFIDKGLSAPYTRISGTVVSTPATYVSIPKILTFLNSPLAVGEGATLAFTVTTWEGSGKTLYWTVETNAGDFNAPSGLFVITNEIGSFTVSPTADLITEGVETFTVAIRSGSITGPVIATSQPININDTSVMPTIVPDSTSVNEGTTVTFTITTTSITNGTILYWTNSGTTSTGDFNDSLNSGSVTIVNNSATITRAITADLITEGSETIIMNLRTGSTSGPIVATSTTVTVVDSSYLTLSPNTVTVSEGNSLTINVSTSAANSTVFYWTINHITTSDLDFSAVSGSFSISGGAASFAVSAVTDLIDETSETFTVSVRSGSVSGPILASTTTLTVTNVTPIYIITPSVTTVVESGTIPFTVTGVGFTNGTTYYWTINHISTADADFTAVSGSFSIASNAGTFNVVGIADSQNAETDETFTVSIRSTSITGTVLITSSAITLTNQSYAFTQSVTTMNEDNNLYYFQVQTTNVAQGTTLYVTVGGGGATAADFNYNTGLTQTITIGSNGSSNQFYISPYADRLFEGTQYFYVYIRVGSGTGTIVLQSPIISIIDTSLPTYYTGTVTISVGSGGAGNILPGPNQGGAGTNGGNTTVSYSGISMTGNGGFTGSFNQGVNTDGNGPGGSWSGSAGVQGQGGGSGGYSNVNQYGGGGGGHGASGVRQDAYGQYSVDFLGLQAAMASAGISYNTTTLEYGTGTPGGGGLGGIRTLNNNASSAYGFNGSYGTGGGGAASGSTAGGAGGGSGGGGFCIIQYVTNGISTTTVSVTSNWTIPAATTSFKIWASGGGGSGGRAPTFAAYAAGGGGAGGIVYYEWVAQ